MLGLGLVGAPFAGSLADAADGAADPDRLNLLVLCIEDLRHDLELMHTPHIDRLAATSVNFGRAYVQQAVCAASRASFLTGCRPDTTGVDYPYNDWFTGEFLPDHPSFPRYFADHGYFVRCYGKWHHGPPLDLHGIHGRTGGGRRFALGESRRDPPPPTEIADVPDSAYRDAHVADRGIEALRGAAGQDRSFFVGLGFHAPHLPWAAPKRYWDLYDPDQIPLAGAPTLPEGVPSFAPATYELPTYETPIEEWDPREPIDEAYARHLRHGYFAAVSYLDAQIGRVLAALEDLALADRTVVLLLSDHGFSLGEQGCWGKHTVYEVATRVPLMLRAPGIVTGVSCDALVEYVDIFPTLCELAGLPVPTYCEGLSVVPLLNRPGRPWKSAAFSQYARWDMLEAYSMSTRQYHYVEWRLRRAADEGYWAGEVGDVRARELYDLQVDPHETTNLVGREGNTHLVAQLSGRLRAGWREALPSGLTNPSDNPPSPLSPVMPD